MSGDTVTIKEDLKPDTNYGGKLVTQIMADVICGKRVVIDKHLKDNKYSATWPEGQEYASRIFLPSVITEEMIERKQLKNNILIDEVSISYKFNKDVIQKGDAVRITENGNSFNGLVREVKDTSLHVHKLSLDGFRTVLVTIEDIEYDDVQVQLLQPAKKH